MNPNLLLAILAVAAFEILGLHAYSIPGQSMMPTMETGDYVIAQRHGANEAPQRGDLATFRIPRSGSSNEWVKRVVGLPGDRIQLRFGQVYVNGVALERKPVDAPGAAIPIFVETTPEGRHYRIIKGGPRRRLDDTAETVVPPGHYYVLGDNRDNSADSRDPSIGLVARENVVARMYVVYWSRSGDRLGTWLE